METHLIRFGIKLSEFMLLLAETQMRSSRCMRTPTHRHAKFAAGDRRIACAIDMTRTQLAWTASLSLRECELGSLHFLERFLLLRCQNSQKCRVHFYDVRGQLR